MRSASRASECRCAMHGLMDSGGPSRIITGARVPVADVATPRLSSREITSSTPAMHEHAFHRKYCEAVTPVDLVMICLPQVCPRNYLLGDNKN